MAFGSSRPRRQRLERQRLERRRLEEQRSKASAQKTMLGGTGTWHSLAGVSQRSVFNQKRGMSSVSICSSALQALQACSHV
jgi:hypothetical protein